MLLSRNEHVNVMCVCACVRRSPDVLVLADVQAVEVVALFLVVLLSRGFAETLDHLGLELHGDVERQHGQQQLLLTGEQRSERLSAHLDRRLEQTTKTSPLNLLVFPGFLLGADGAELLSLQSRFPEIVLRHPQVENPDAVHAHKQHGIRHQLRSERRKRGGKIHSKIIKYKKILNVSNSHKQYKNIEK